MPLGVFAITQDGEPTGADPTMFLQLAVSKQGVINGTFQNTATNTVKAVEGMVDKQTQRAAWTVARRVATAYGNWHRESNTRQYRGACSLSPTTRLSEPCSSGWKSLEAPKTIVSQVTPCGVCGTTRRQRPSVNHSRE